METAERQEARDTASNPTLKADEARDTASSPVLKAVKQLVNEVKQPFYGYLPLRSFAEIRLETTSRLAGRLNENIDSRVIGTAVDYLVRFHYGTRMERILNIELATSYREHREKEARNLVNSIHGIDNTSIKNLCKLLTYSCNGVAQVEPNEDTIDNIRLLVRRTIDCFNCFGPIKYTGVNLNSEQLTHTNIKGAQIDYLTADTVWDLKVSKDIPTSSNTLQVLVYYLLGKYLKDPRFNNICRIGIYNAKWNRAYILQVDQIPSYTIRSVCTEVIGLRQEGLTDTFW